MNQRPGAGLLLDEMFSPAIAAELRALGHDVIAIADRPDLRSKSDDEVFAWASTEKLWLLPENVKDFRPIMLRALQAGPPGCGAPVRQQPGLPQVQEESRPADQGAARLADRRSASAAGDRILVSRRSRPLAAPDQGPDIDDGAGAAPSEIALGSPHHSPLRPAVTACPCAVTWSALAAGCAAPSRARRRGG